MDVCGSICIWNFDHRHGRFRFFVGKRDAERRNAGASAKYDDPQFSFFYVSSCPQAHGGGNPAFAVQYPVRAFLGQMLSGVAGGGVRYVLCSIVSPLSDERTPVCIRKSVSASVYPAAVVCAAALLVPERTVYPQEKAVAVIVDHGRLWARLLFGKLCKPDPAFRYHKNFLKIIFYKIWYLHNFPFAICGAFYGKPRKKPVKWAKNAFAFLRKYAYNGYHMMFM